MNETEQQIREREYETNLQKLQELRPIDDEFMRCMFKDNIPLAELVLRIITGKRDLIITECETQRDMKRLAGARSICLDAYGADSTGKKYDIEIQKGEEGASPHRARYHSSVMDIENLNAGQKFEELPDTYVIFIVDEDVYGKGEPFEDGEHILYVNGEYRGDSEIGKLMHDFNCADAKDMYFELMAERTEYLKNNSEGVKKMSKIGEEIAIMAAIRTYRECNIDDATIIERIKERFQVTNEAAVEYVKDKCLV